MAHGILARGAAALGGRITRLPAYGFVKALRLCYWGSVRLNDVPEPAELIHVLAADLARLAEYGPEDFYAGDIAQTIVADVRAGGGFLSAADLAACRARYGAIARSDSRTPRRSSR